MEPNPRQGRRELVAILVAAALIQMCIGALASLRGDTIAWGSLVRRPLLLGGLWIAATVTKRLGYVLLTAWFAYLTLDIRAHRHGRSNRSRADGDGGGAARSNA